MYIAKLDLDPDTTEEYIAFDDSVDEAIKDAIDRGYIKRNYQGGFWIVDEHIVIDACLHPSIPTIERFGDWEFCQDCEQFVGWEDL